MEKEIEALDDFMDLVTCQGCFEKAQKCYDIIEEALTEKQDLERFTRLVVEKKVELMSLFLSSSAEQYNNQFVYDRYQLTEEEFAFIKAMIARYGDEK